MERISRTPQQKEILIKYFKKLQVFKDLLLGDKDAYNQLTNAIEVT